jgi:Cu-Zn family superoxide dismutase
MRRAIPLLVSILALAACSGGGDNSADSLTDTTGAAARRTDSAQTGGVADTTSATAAMRSAAGRDVGTLTLKETAQGISVSGHLTGLPPGTHGIHFHMVGQCTPPFESAGGHWNPTSKQHGTQNPQGPHLGDLPNITVAADSSAHIEGTSPGGTLRGANGLADADGAAVVIHASADDNRTDPSGNSGNRIVCGVVSGS